MNDTQKACLHVFVGRADGVHCKKCGLHLTAEGYKELTEYKPVAASETAEPPKKKGGRKSATKKEATAGE